MSNPLSHIRNFSIIAHIDHGKSTLSDRFLELTQTVTKREMREQLLDSMDIERERGITIKAQTARMIYPYQGTLYTINLIDTPGHVDFTYEVSRSLAASDGAILVVDASQGIEAQTISNVYLALEQGLEILPVINKIDLPNANPDLVKEELQEDIGLDISKCILTSAKMGTNVSDVLDAVIKHIPPPSGHPQNPLQALLFDSWFDPYQGVICVVRLVNGELKKGDKIYFCNAKIEYEVLKCGFLTPKMLEGPGISAGEVGFIICGIKNIRDITIGDTLTTLEHRGENIRLPGFKKIKPVLFSGIFPVEPNEFESLRNALEKLTLNDSSLAYEPENSSALGLGFRVGFLGLLHMEIVQERLEREYGLDLINTAPSVIYEIHLKDKQVKIIENPNDIPDLTLIEEIREPIIQVSIYTPREYIGSILSLCEEKRGKQQKMDYLSQSRMLLVYDLPFAEVVLDFNDRLKSCSRGYASMDYEPKDSQAADLVKLDLLINNDPIDALASIVHKDKAFTHGKALCKRLKETMHRQQFELALQAAIGKKIIARESLGALRKNVTAKCYGGDITRKKKLLEKQKKGKKRMKRVGKVDIPQSAFLAVLTMGSGEKKKS
jgi:GTP-binding protein LepA